MKQLDSIKRKKLTRDNIREALKIYAKVAKPKYYPFDRDNKLLEDELDTIFEIFEEYEDKTSVEERYGYHRGSIEEKFVVLKTREYYAGQLFKKGVEYLLMTNANLTGTEPIDEKKRLKSIESSIYDAWEENGFPTHRKHFV